MMKSRKLLFLATFVLALGITSSASAAALADDLITEVNDFNVGDTVCYTIELTAFGGTLTDVNVYFYVPILAGEGSCVGIEKAPGGIPIAMNLTLLNGVLWDMNCYDDANLAYVIQPGDLNDADGAKLTAKLGTEAKDAGEQDCDQETKTVNILPPLPCIEITKDVNCSISKEGDEVTYTICIKNCGPTDINEITSLTDTQLPGDLKALMEAEMVDVLEPDEQICIDIDFQMPSGPDPFVNEASVEVEDIYDTAAVNGPAIAEVNLVHPSFTIEKSCREEPLDVCDVAIFDIRVENTGDICLHFELDELGEPCDFNLPAGGVKEWETHILVEEPCDVENEIIGTATLLPGECGDPCDCLRNVLPVAAANDCTVSGGATRTPGFWKTHYYIAEYVFDNCPDTDPNLDLGWTHVENIDEMMAIFWAKKAGMNKLCQARLQASFHFMAAVLNDCMPDGLDFESFTGLTKQGVADILGGCDEGAIKDLIGDLAAYNEEGDDVEVVFPAGLTAYNAQPKYAREQSDGIFETDFEADCEACADGLTATSTQGSKGKGKGPKK
jgi:uncharacterized repeat protein (TIGR01451 family)